MSTNFKIEFRTSNGNLHVDLSGDFDGSSAHELVNFIHKKYDGEGRVFIKTNNLRRIHPFGCSMFRHHLNPWKLPASQLYFKGKKGFEIAPNGSKVLVVPEKKHRCRCDGNCAVCKCRRKHPHSRFKNKKKIDEEKTRRVA